jgi:hypothetical protein
MLDRILCETAAIYFQLLPDTTSCFRRGICSDYGLLMFISRAGIFGSFQRLFKTYCVLVIKINYYIYMYSVEHKNVFIALLAISFGRYEHYQANVILNLKRLVTTVCPVLIFFFSG